MVKFAVTCPLLATHNSFFVVRSLVIKSLLPHYFLTDSIDQADFQVHVGTPEESQIDLYLHGKKPLIFFTFVESDSVKKFWVEALNTATMVWVSSEFTKEILLKSGVTSPIHIIPLGIDFDTTPAMQPANGNGHPFTIMWQGVRQSSVVDGRITDGDRKRGYLVEEAFRQCNIPNSRLILKSLPGEKGAVDDRSSNIWRIEKSLSRAEINKLDQLTDLFIWPTRGEGFGLIPLEKLSNGVSVKVTPWSAPLEYLNDFPNSALSDYSLEKVLYNDIETQMANVPLSSVIDSIHWAHENLALLRSRREMLAKTAREKWDFRLTTVPAIHNTLHQFLNNH